MYRWRQLSPSEREQILEGRKTKHHPWHSVPHEGGEHASYLLSAACYEHEPVIGANPQRIHAFEESLFETLQPLTKDIHAWCILPNHYHFLLSTEDMLQITKMIGLLHGRTSFQWNMEDNLRGKRKIWHSCFDRRMRSESHFWATMNYVHHNPVKHGYVTKWQDWPYSSAECFLQSMTREEIIRIWTDFPIDGYGKGWDDPDM